ncbi:hypothetical protein [Curvivirga sp.]|uniref:hypothetical protein n=1 Tax=Curvivirga sp. TaxID=2856848 RepID=UPI003B5A0AAF
MKVCGEDKGGLLVNIVYDTNIHRKKKLLHINLSLLSAALIFFLGLFWLSQPKALFFSFCWLSFASFVYGMKYGVANTRCIQLDEYSSQAAKKIWQIKTYIWVMIVAITYIPVILFLPVLIFDSTPEFLNEIALIKGVGVYDDVANKLRIRIYPNSKIYLKLYSSFVFIGLTGFGWLIIWRFLDLVRAWLDWGYYATWVKQITNESSMLRVLFVWIFCVTIFCTSLLFLFTSIKSSELIKQAGQWDELAYFCLYFFEAGLLIGGFVLYAFFVFGLMQPMFASLGAVLKIK